MITLDLQAVSPLPNIQSCPFSIKATTDNGKQMGVAMFRCLKCHLQASITVVWFMWLIWLLFIFYLSHMLFVPFSHFSWIVYFFMIPFYLLLSLLDLTICCTIASPVWVSRNIPFLSLAIGSFLTSIWSVFSWRLEEDLWQISRVLSPRSFLLSDTPAWEFYPLRPPYIPSAIFQFRKMSRLCLSSSFLCQSWNSPGNHSAQL